MPLPLEAMAPLSNRSGLIACEPCLLGSNDVFSEGKYPMFQVAAMESGYPKEATTPTSPPGRSRPRTAEFRDLTAEIHSLSEDLAEEDELCRDGDENETPQVHQAKALHRLTRSKPNPPLSAARRLLLERGASSKERKKQSKPSKKFAVLGCCSEMVEVQKEFDNARGEFTRSMLEMQRAKRALEEEVHQLECEREYLLQEAVPESSTDDGECIEGISARRDMLDRHLALQEEERQTKIEAAKEEITSLKKQTQQLRDEVDNYRAMLDAGKDAHFQTMKSMKQKSKTPTIARIYQEELEKEREKADELQREVEEAEEKKTMIFLAADAVVESRAQEIERLHADMKAVKNGNESQALEVENAQKTLRQREDMYIQLEVEIAMLKEPAKKLLTLFGQDLDIAVEAGSEDWIAAFGSGLRSVQAALESRTGS